jgi:hypothetical protein
MRRRQAYAVPNGLGSYAVISSKGVEFVRFAEQPERYERIGEPASAQEPATDKSVCPKCGKTGSRGMHRHIQFCKGSH